MTKTSQNLITDIQCGNNELMELAEEMRTLDDTENLLFELLDLEIIRRRNNVFQLMNSVSHRKFTQLMQGIGYV